MGLDSPGGTDDDDFLIQRRDDYEMRENLVPQEIKTIFDKFKKGDILKVHATLLGLQNTLGALSGGVLCKIDLYKSHKGNNREFSGLRIAPISGSFSFTPKVFGILEFVDAVRKGSIVRTGGNLDGRPGHTKF